MTPTDQQQHGIQLSKQHSIVKIDACSGSGKTSSLILIANEHKVPSIYVAFNKAIATEASGKFPSHVTCQTTHSLAYAVFGRNLRNKLSRPTGKYVNVAGTGSEIARYYKLQPIINAAGDITATAAAIGLYVKKTVERFEQSADDALDKHHVPKFDMEKVVKVYPGIVKDVLGYAKKFWEDRINTTSCVLASHDTYLKLYQMSKPVLAYEVIYLDEAADTTKCVLDIVMNQKHMKIILVGDRRQNIYCQPAGTKVRVVSNDGKYNSKTPTQFQQKLIENIVEDDLVVSYQIPKAHLHKTGKRVSKVGSRLYSGNIVTVVAAESTSSYTADHHVIVRLGNENDGKQVVYVMKKGEQFRIGVAPWRYSSGMFGAAQRASAEKADGLWIIGVYDKMVDALLWENIYSFKYNIPQVCFKDRSMNNNQVNGEIFWSMFGNNRQEAERLLKEFDLLIDQPLWGRRKSGSMCAVKVRSNFVTPARNLVSGMLCAVLNEDDIHNFSSHSRIGMKYWKPIKVSKEYKECKVYSLEVETDHTYFGDNILTHNCWRGADNAMALVDCHTAPLTKSFRYGNAIAEVATKILHNDMTVTGRDDLECVVGFGVVDRSLPHMYLFRTNSLLLAEAVAAVDRGESVKIEIDVRDFLKVLESSVALYNNNISKVKHERILPYPSWKVMTAEAKEISGELGRLVSIVESGSAPHIASVLERYVAPEKANATYTTAHKSKGRECDQVILANDYGTNYKKGVWVGQSEHEENLLYVAATRSMRVLEINSTVAEVLDKYKIEYIGNSGRIEEDEDKLLIDYEPEVYHPMSDSFTGG